MKKWILIFLLILCIVRRTELIYAEESAGDFMDLYDFSAVDRQAETQTGKYTFSELTTEYLSKNGGHCDSRDAEYFTMNQLRKEIELQKGPYWHFAVDNRAMLNAIFGVYMSLKPDDGFSLCWGELSLRKKGE